RPSIESGRENRKARRRRNSDTCLRAVGVVVGQGYCWICCWTGAVWWYSAVVWSVVVTPSACSRNRLAWRQSAPVYPFVCTLVSPVGDTTTSMIRAISLLPLGELAFQSGDTFMGPVVWRHGPLPPCPP